MKVDTPEVVACDTSVAVPLVVESHPFHQPLVDALSGCRPRLLGHAAVETYSVLTRLPGDARVAPRDAVRLIEQRFGDRSEGPQIAFDVSTLASLSERGVSGGAVYDALVASWALAHDLILLTRDLRALATYAQIGARTRMLV